MASPALPPQNDHLSPGCIVHKTFSESRFAARRIVIELLDIDHWLTRVLQLRTWAGHVLPTWPMLNLLDPPYLPQNRD